MTEKTTIVLLADDDPGDRELTARALARHGLPIDLRTVCDGEEALEYLRHQGRYADPAIAPRPDLVLLDLNMPKLDGRQVLERMQEDEELRGVPVVVLTTSAYEQDILRSYNLGCNSFITKPVEISDFIDVVSQLGNYWFQLVALPTQTT